MTNHPATPWDRALHDIGDKLTASLQEAGTVMAVQGALDRLMQGEPAKALELITSLPDDALQKAVSAAAKLTALLATTALDRGLKLEEPFDSIPREAFTENPPTGA
jgi:hypothetical protein